MIRKYLLLALLFGLYLPIFHAEGLGNMCNVSFFASLILTYFLLSDWKEKEWGTVALIALGNITLQGYICMIIWFNPEIYALFIYSIITGTLLGALFLRTFPMQVVGKKLDSMMPSVKTLDKLFESKD